VPHTWIIYIFRFKTKKILKEHNKNSVIFAEYITYITKFINRVLAHFSLVTT